MYLQKVLFPPYLYIHRFHCRLQPFVQLRAQCGGIYVGVNVLKNIHSTEVLNQRLGFFFMHSQALPDYGLIVVRAPFQLRSIEIAYSFTAGSTKEEVVALSAVRAGKPPQNSPKE